MSIALLIISDGRYEYLARTIESGLRNLPKFHHVIWVDDHDHSLGYGGAIREGWRRARETDAQFIFHLEGDFTFNRPVPIEAMRHVLETHPSIVQLAFRRQPWNDEEKAAGGQVELHPDDYVQNGMGALRWLEHRRNFTTNPSLYPRWVFEEEDWPDRDQSEGVFGAELLKRRPNVRFALWGARDTTPWCAHIGEVRAGVGY